MTGPGAATAIGLYVCTYRRNDELRRLLGSLVTAAHNVGDGAEVGVVVVDDNRDGRARAVAGEFEGRFPLGLHYRHVGGADIAAARNVGIEAAGQLGDWVAMTDDDIVVPPDWFEAMLSVQSRTGADAVTGPLLLSHGPNSPAWLRDQPFDEIGLLRGADDQPVDTCATGNSMIRTAWLEAHPDIRFDADLGRIGGEDMVFFRRAVDAGLDARFSSRVAVREVEPPARSTFGYQLRRALWMGNSQYVTNLRLGHATGLRLVLRGLRRLVRAAVRPLARMARGEAPQFRYALAAMAEGAGFLVGAIGVEMEHR